jgi:hypothetical protein
MNRIEVVNHVHIYEENGEDIKGALPSLTVESHPIYGERVVLKWLDRQPVTVIASDLLAAIKNATNAS